MWSSSWSEAHLWEIVSKNDNLSFLRVWGLPLRPSRQSWLGGLDCYVDVGVAGGEGVVVGEDHLFGAVGAEGGFVVFADDGEGVEDVGGVCAGEAVEVEVEGVEAGAQVVALRKAATAASTDRHSAVAAMPVVRK